MQEIFKLLINVFLTSSFLHLIDSCYCSHVRANRSRLSSANDRCCAVINPSGQESLFSSGLFLQIHYSESKVLKGQGSFKAELESIEQSSILAKSVKASRHRTILDSSTVQDHHFQVSETSEEIIDQHEAS